MRKLIALLAVALALQPGQAPAQDYPTRPIRLVVPFAAAGGTDILARLIAQKLTEAWGQPVVVENRPGASGNLGTDFVAKSAPDGYTIVMAINTHTVNASLYDKLPFDPINDFAPVVLAATTSNILVVHPSVPVKTVSELVAYAKHNPGKLSYSSGGSGTTAHLAAELFKSMTGTDMVHVPYKGGGAAYRDLVGGQVQLSFVGIPGTVEFIRAGRLRPIAVTTAKRAAAMPEVPTIAEAGLPGYDVTTWWGILAPAGTPRAVVNKLHTEVTRILQLPDIREKFVAQGFEHAPSTPESFSAFLKEEVVKWSKVVKASGARPE